MKEILFAIIIIFGVISVSCIVFKLCKKDKESSVLIDGKKTKARLPKPNWHNTEIIYSKQPFIYRLKGFLSPDECHHLIRRCVPRFNRSQVIDNKTGESVNESARTSSSCFMTRKETEIIEDIENRAAAVIGVPPSHIESLQMVRYFPGQEYTAHHDFFHHFKPRENQRYATILVYLNDDFQGGNTDFPQVGVSAKPKEGDGILWYSCWRPYKKLSKVSKCFDESLHQGTPPTKGVKYALNIWYRFEPTD